MALYQPLLYPYRHEWIHRIRRVRWHRPNCQASAQSRVDTVRKCGNQSQAPGDRSLEQRGLARGRRSRGDRRFYHSHARHRRVARTNGACGPALQYRDHRLDGIPTSTIVRPVRRLAGGKTWPVRSVEHGLLPPYRDDGVRHRSRRRSSHRRGQKRGNVVARGVAHVQDAAQHLSSLSGLVRGKRPCHFESRSAADRLRACTGKRVLSRHQSGPFGRTAANA